MWKEKCQSPFEINHNVVRVIMTTSFNISGSFVCTVSVFAVSLCPRITSVLPHKHPPGSCLNCTQLFLHT